MNISDILAQTGAIDAISRQVGLPPAAAKSAADALLPAILGGMTKQAQGLPAPGQAGGQSPTGGLGDLLGSVLGGGSAGGSAGGLGGLLDAVTGNAPTPAAPGNDILGQIFGSKDVSRTVADHAAQRTGISADILKKMLPLLAMAVAGYLARQNSGQGSGPTTGGGTIGGGGIGDILGQVLGGGSSSAAPAGTPASAGKSGGLGGLISMLDFDGDGNPLDDIIGMAGKLRR